MDRYADIAYKSAEEDIIYQYEDDYNSVPGGIPTTPTGSSTVIWMVSKKL